MLECNDTKKKTWYFVFTAILFIDSVQTKKYLSLRAVNWMVRMAEMSAIRKKRE